MFGFLATHASASCATVHPSSSSASFVNCFTFSILALPPSLPSPSIVLWNNSGCVVKREPSGIPSLYLPVSSPDASADQTVVPVLYFLKIGLP